MNQFINNFKHRKHNIFCFIVQNILIDNQLKINSSYFEVYTQICDVESSGKLRRKLFSIENRITIVD